MQNAKIQLPELRIIGFMSQNTEGVFGTKY